MKFTEISKNYPKRKYLVINAFESTWNNNHIIGVMDVKIEGPITITSDDGYLKHYQPFEVMPIKDDNLNKIGVNYLLYVYIPPNTDFNLQNYLEGDEYKSLLRDTTINEIINGEK